MKFCRIEDKTKVLLAARAMKPPNFFVNESLTPQRQTISYVLRKAKREFPSIIAGQKTIDGKSIVYVKPPNPSARSVKMQINSRSKLEDFCTRTLDKPLSHFLTEWRH